MNVWMNKLTTLSSSLFGYRIKRWKVILAIKKVKTTPKQTKIKYLIRHVAR